jgi:hypothetical protein
VTIYIVLFVAEKDPELLALEKKKDKASEE